ncbi:MAG TPA: hypothetical protein VGX76_07315, partial [Pirellulales bacterium]|nr:hypothetical protein [Pirellulales bacterium]
MDSVLLISIAAFVGVAALVGGLAMTLKGDRENKIENRLDTLTGTGPTAAKSVLLQQSVLSTPLDAVPGVLDAIVERLGRLKLLFVQADTNLTPAKFFAISAGLLVVGTIVGIYAGFKPGLAPLMGLSLGSLPLLWLIWRKKRRL